MKRRTTVAKLALLLLSCSTTACGRRSADGLQERATPAKSSAPLTPVDRLLPGELSASSQQAFGLPVPKGMRIDRAFPDAAYLIGEVTLAGLTEYLRTQARVGAPEVSAKSILFERAKIPAQGEDKLYQFRLTQRGREVQLVIRDVSTPVNAPTTPMSDEERWRRVGRKPNGDPLDVADLR